MKELLLEEQQLNCEFPDSIDDEYHFNEWNLKSNQVKIKIMVEFHQTMMGRKFYESDVPRLIEAVEKVAKALDSNQIPLNEGPGLKEKDKVIKTVSVHALESLFHQVTKVLEEYAEKHSKINRGIK